MILTEAFAWLPDPRAGAAQRHDLREMILMALCAVLCGTDISGGMLRAENNEGCLKRYLAHGTLSHDTYHAPQNFSTLRKFALSPLR